MLLFAPEHGTLDKLGSILLEFSFLVCILLFKQKTVNS